MDDRGLSDQERSYTILAIPGSIEICDHCSKKVPVLHVDFFGFHLCHTCWPFYHDYKCRNKIRKESGKT